MTIPADPQAPATRLLDAARTIERLRDALERERSRVAEPLAVIGMALRMPGGADTPAAFWRLLEDGVDAVGSFPADRADAAAITNPDPDNPGTAYVTSGAFLDRVDGFDPGVFGISPRDAVGMDPQQRLALELAWEALERAGYAPDGLVDSQTGVFVGVSTTDYVRMRQQLGDPDDVDHYQLLGEPSFVAGRISHVLGLQGPSQVVDTTCSSSLVALDAAVRALRDRRCDMALAGGVNLMLSPYGFLLMSKFRALAPDGRCKTFDEAADGYVRGEGAGLVVLKRLSDAIAAGDHIRGVVLGSATNHDGASSGLTVPNGAAQERVLRAALADGGLRPGDVDLVEAHGTGTSLGDPIELRALEAVYGAGRPAGDPLLVASVKTNVGHLEPAAGIAGVAKVLLALDRGIVPPHLHLEHATSRVPWATMHLDVPTRARPWPQHDRPRRAAVSSFGASGTNAHVVLGGPVEQADPQAPDPRPEAILVSARTAGARAALAGRLAAHLRAGEDALADIAFTTQVGRARLGAGAVVVAASREDAVLRLDALAGGAADAPWAVARRGSRLQRSAWLLPGQGAQTLGMAGGLRAIPAFERALEDALAQLDPVDGTTLAALVWGDGDPRAVDDTAVAQPALFAVSYALGSMLLELGVRRPAALLGHSVGELAAACLGGALDLPDAARLVSARGRLMSALPAGGTMVALSCPEDELRAAIEPGDIVAVAAVNGPSDVVASGAAADVERVVARLEARGIRAHRLRVSHAFHSPLLEPALEELAAVSASVVPRAPSIPIVSNVTGTWWDETTLTADYWVRHAAGAVRFGDGVRLLHADGLRTFIELGANPVLIPMARRVVEDEAVSWIATLRRGQHDLVALQEALGRLDLEGGRVDWRTLHAGRRVRRVALPTYPWERERFWFRERAAPRLAGPAVAGLGQRVPGAGTVFAEQAAAPPETSLAWVVERAVRAARAAGVTWSELGSAVCAPPVGPGADVPWTVETTVRRNGRGTCVELSGAAAAQRAAGAPWIPHGTIVLHGPGSGGDATAWGALVADVETAVAAEVATAGRLTGLGSAACSDPDRVASHAVTLRGKAIADVVLLAADGTAVGYVTGVSWSAPAATQTPWYPAADVLLKLRWDDAASAEAVSPPAAVRLCGGDDDLVTALRDELARRDVHVICAAAAPAAPEIGAGELVVLLAPLTTPAASALAHGDLRAHALDRELALCALVAKLDELGTDARVAALTRGGAATPDQETHAPLAATLHGLGRVLALEHPSTWGGTVDLDPAGDDDVAAIVDALLGLPADDEQAVRGARRLAARVVRRGERPLPAAPDRLHRPGTVLVTGGLGAIGVQLCRHLARAGTERLVLLARSALPPQDEWAALGSDDPRRARVEAVRGLRALGAEVEVLAVDVCDEDAVGALVASLVADERLPLRGVIHAAGVSGPQFAREIDAQTYTDVWSPKVEGAWALHAATREADLDLFICFSSVAASWGSQHLASYAAANAFLDALACARRAEGLPGLTVAWGTWALRSGLFGDDVLEFMESIGLRQLAADQCLELLSRLQGAGATSAMVCAADWATYRPVMEARRPRPRLSAIEVAEQAGATGDEDLLQALAAAGPDGRDALLVELVARAVGAVLELDPTGLDADGEVFELGVDSLMVMELVGRLRGALAVELRASELFERSSIRAWAGLLADRVAGAQAPSAGDAHSRWQDAGTLAADAVLAEDIVPAAAAPAPPGRCDDVVLTGATGFVGAFVLRDLLAQGARRVRCLVRAGSPREGWERVAENAAHYVELPAGAQQRVDVVCGDLAAEHLGLGGAVALDALVAGADGVLHAGAHVHFAHPYERMRAANVGGTETLLRACARSGVPLHHVSTYGIWGMPVDGRDRIAEADDIATAGRLVTGYVQSKWAAERLVLDAAARGVAVTCHRLGRVLGDATTGAALTSHFTLGVIKGCLQLGAAPALELDVEMTPVDYVSAALVRLAATHPADGSVFHLVNPGHMAFATLVEHLRSRGWELETLEPAAWYERLEASLAGGDENALHTVMGTVRELVVGGERAIAYDDARARAALAGSAITCPPLDERLLRTYLDRLLADGFLPPPTAVHPDPGGPAHVRTSS